MRFLHFVPVCLAGFAALACAAMQHGYVQARLAGVLSTKPDSQVGLGLIAVGSGGVLGRGLGQGWMKMGYVPESHNDFVFAIIAEEFGFAGSVFVLGAFTAFGYVCYRLVCKVRDPFLRYVVCGYALMVCMQAAVNLLVVSGWAPAKGIDLPFVSTGGTSLMFCLAAVGLISPEECRPLRLLSHARADYGALYREFWPILAAACPVTRPATSTGWWCGRRPARAACSTPSARRPCRGRARRSRTTPPRRRGR